MTLPNCPARMPWFSGTLRLPCVTLTVTVLSVAMIPEKLPAPVSPTVKSLVWRMFIVPPPKAERARVETFELK